MDKLTTVDTAMAAKVTETAPLSNPPFQEDRDPIETGDTVTFFGKNNARLKGVVKWIGIYKSIPNAGVIVGIECVSIVDLFIGKHECVYGEGGKRRR